MSGYVASSVAGAANGAAGGADAKRENSGSTPYQSVVFSGAPDSSGDSYVRGSEAVEARKRGSAVPGGAREVMGGRALHRSVWSEVRAAAECLLHANS